MYIPQGCVKLSELKTQPQIRLGIQGYPGTGKTWSALTFPNPIVVNLDRGLGAHSGREDVIEVPFWDTDFCKSEMQNYTPSKLKDLLLIWLHKNGGKLTSEQTLVWDGGTTTQNAYHVWYADNRVITSSGKEDDFGSWRLKLQFFSDLCEMLKRLKCNVVYISHEVEKKEKDGTYRGKVRPLLTGGFDSEIGGYFTDWFRQIATSKPTDYSTYDAAKLSKWGMTLDEFKAFVSSYPRDTVYYWRTSSDDECDCKASSLVNYPSMIPANYQHFQKWMKHK